MAATAAPSLRPRPASRGQHQLDPASESSGPLPHGRQAHTAFSHMLQSALKHKNGISVRVPSTTPELVGKASNHTFKRSDTFTAIASHVAKQGVLKTHLKAASDTIRAQLGLDPKYRQACDYNGKSSQSTYLQPLVKGGKVHPTKSTMRRTSERRRATRRQPDSDGEDSDPEANAKEFDETLGPRRYLKCLFNDTHCAVCHNGSGTDLMHATHYSRIIAHLIRDLGVFCEQCQQPIKNLRELTTRHVQCPRREPPMNGRRCRWPCGMQPDSATIFAMGGNLAHRDSHKHSHRVGKQGQRYINAWLHARDFYRAMGVHTWPVECPNPYFYPPESTSGSSLVSPQDSYGAADPMFPWSLQARLPVPQSSGQGPSTAGWTTLTTSSVLSHSSNPADQPLAYQYEGLDTPESHLKTMASGNANPLWNNVSSDDHTLASTEVPHQLPFTLIVDDGPLYSATGVEFAGGAAGNFTEDQTAHGAQEPLSRLSLQTGSFIGSPQQHEYQSEPQDYSGFAADDEFSNLFDFNRQITNLDEFALQQDSFQHNH